jgi:hypothetical protein
MIVVSDMLVFDLSRSLEKQLWERWRKRSLEKELLVEDKGAAFESYII